VVVLILFVYCGIAGRIGVWYDYLLEIKPLYPIRFYLRPAGGEHKIERYFLVFDNDKVTKVKKEEKDIFEDKFFSLGNVEDYIDLASYIKD
jgi:hypothetical protein